MPERTVPERSRERAPGVYRRVYGVTPAGHEVAELELLAASGMSVSVIEYGGIVNAIRVPDRDGHWANVVLGRPSLAAYMATNPYLGALIGRFANRIRRGVFQIDGVEQRVTVNDGPNHLHGGKRGFDKRVWRGEIDADSTNPAVVLHLTSADGEEGYPGTVDVQARYELTPDAALRVSFAATTDAPTLVSLTSHNYFNLAGEGADTVYGHRLLVAADHYTPVDETVVPTGEIAPVDGTPFDLRAGVEIGAAVRTDHPQILRAKGFDHNFVARRERGNDLHLAARLWHPGSGRSLEIHTTEPGLQVYTGNGFDGTLTGTSGALYRQGDGVALETQNFPDAPNRPEFPSAILRPGATYRSVTELRFGVEG